MVQDEDIYDALVRGFACKPALVAHVLSSAITASPRTQQSLSYRPLRLNPSPSAAAMMYIP